MGIDTKADDWMCAVHRLKVNTTARSGSISFKIGSVAAAQAALIGCSGSISGSGFPPEQFFALPTFWLKSPRGPWSLKDIKGDRGTVTQNNPFFPGALGLGAFRPDGTEMFEGTVPTSETWSFTISGGWMVKMIVNLSAYFVVPAPSAP